MKIQHKKGKPGGFAKGVLALIAITSIQSMVFAQGNSAPVPDTSSKEAKSNKLANETIFKDWRVICPGSKTGVLTTCVMTPFLKKTKSKNSGVGIAIEAASKKARKSRPLIIFKTALDTYLPAGVVFEIGNRRGIKLPFRSCYNQGCLAPFRPSKRILTRLRRGATMKITTLALNGKQRKEVISLHGFTAAYLLLNKKRNQ